MGVPPPRGVTTAFFKLVAVITLSATQPFYCRHATLRDDTKTAAAD